jgi:hypothetical protein
MQWEIIMRKMWRDVQECAVTCWERLVLSPERHEVKKNWEAICETLIGYFSVKSAALSKDQVV